MMDLCVIGGGASGLILAVCAARQGLSVTVLEKEDRVGRKILSTGNGRCNLSNADLDPSHYHGSCADLAVSCLKEDGAQKVRQFWSSTGIEYASEEGRYYPRSLQASSVLNALRRQLDMLSVRVLTGVFVKSVRHDESGFTIQHSGGREVSSLAALCCGGMASPALGSDGSGYDLCRRLGLEVSALRPGLCRLKSGERFLKQMSGVRLTVPCTLLSDHTAISTLQDEILFTDDGLSGPAALNLSRQAGQILQEGHQAAVSLDLVPEIDSASLETFLSARFSQFGDFAAEDVLEGFLNKRMIPQVLTGAGIPRTQSGRDMKEEQIASLTRTMKAFPISLSGLYGYRDAQVTIGGVTRGQISENFEAVPVPGLFLTGEILDVDGDCGGYNLLFAAMSAIKASERAVKLAGR